MLSNNLLLLLPLSFSTCFKSFDVLIANVEAGKRVDIRNLPVPPQVQQPVSVVKPSIKPQKAEEDFEVIEGNWTKCF